MQFSLTKTGEGQKGFSLLEMMLATIILLVGLVAIAQLVPASILLNYRNRTDSSALVFAQRELDQMLDQPITSSFFTDVLGNPCNLGLSSSPNVIQGSPVQVTYSSSSNGDEYSQVLIDFTASPLTNYSFTFPDSTDPTGTTYDVRWAVIITGNGSIVSSKRFILGVRQLGGNGYFQPITLDTVVAR
jgi:prepilin-type N-terminal cleavage/methylation domain-containing protein